MLVGMKLAATILEIRSALSSKCEHSCISLAIPPLGIHQREALAHRQEKTRTSTFISSIVYKSETFATRIFHLDPIDLTLLIREIDFLEENFLAFWVTLEGSSRNL